MDSKNGSKKMPKNAIFYYCEKCNFKCSKKSNFDNHLSTLKHKKIVNDSNGIFGIKLWKCGCGKEYKYDSGYYRHKKTCTYIDNNETNEKNELNEINEKNELNEINEINNRNNLNNNNNTKNDIIKQNNIITPDDVSKELILKLVEENSEIKSMLFKQFENMQEQQIQIQNQMIEQQKIMHSHINDLIPKVGNNNNTINNNVKQKFNINIFLNEQCKDALTMNEFIDKIKVTMDNLMITKNMGLYEGVSNIFIENMNKLSLHERPMHCTDVKRETVYIKCDDDDGENGGIPRWEKDEQNKKLKSALNKITHVQRKNMNMWIDKHPNWQFNSVEQDEYLKLVKNCTDDLNENKRGDKIIKKLCNEVYLGDTSLTPTFPSN
tara:strand:+ start:182 stop:1318 length:1137 start_codon:yes stop_codon:yes gene_type:complete